MTAQLFSSWTEMWESLAALPFSVALREATWAYPALETIHLIGIALLVGPILVFDLRVLGLRAGLPLADTHDLLLPWVWTGFALNAVSGLLLFASDAAEFAANPAFAAKMSLIVVAGINAAVFQWRFGRTLAGATPHGSAAFGAPMGAKVMALISVVTWLAVITAGRLIAYTG